MVENKPVNISVIGAGSTYGVFLVKWALQLKHDQKSNRENIPIPPIGTISYSNTTERNRDLVMEVLLDELAEMPFFAESNVESFLKGVKGYTNWREMVASESPHLVVVSSPLQTHVPYMRELLTDFKIRNILCEPPLGHLNEVESLKNIVQLASEKDVKIGTNQQYAILYDKLKDVPLNPKVSKGEETLFSDLLSGLDGLNITLITHGTRVWRKMQGVGEQEILEDLGPHIYGLIPETLRGKEVKIKNVKKEGDNLFLNFIEYDLILGNTSVRITLGYHRKLKSLKIIFRKDKKDYEFHIQGATHPETGEYTRRIEGKNYAYFFEHFPTTDLVKTSFISSLAGKPIVPIEEGIQSLEFVRTLYMR